jgi:hypothetical protein
LKSIVSHSRHITLLGSPSRPIREAARKALLRAGGKAEPALLRALSSSGKASIREQAAELLASVGSAHALPSLVQALADDSLFVRHDALWAIEAICRMRPASLAAWLRLNINHPTQLHSRVLRWWRLNQRFLSRNELLRAPSSGSRKPATASRPTA